MKKDRLNGNIAISVATVFFGLNVPVLKELMPEWISFLDATTYRIVGAAILFWIASLFTKKEKIEHGDYLLILFSGILGLYAFMYTFNLSLEMGSPVDISIIMTIPPILVILFSAILFKTLITKNKIIGIGLSIAGTLLIIFSQGGGDEGTRANMMGNVWCAVSGTIFAAYLISIQKLSLKYSPVTLLKWLFTSASIAAIPIGAHTAFKSHIFTAVTTAATTTAGSNVSHTMPILMLLFVIIFPTFLAYMLTPYAIRRIGTELVAMYQYLIPMVASVVSIIMGQAHIRWDQPVAMVIILFGVYLTSKQATPKPKIKTATDQSSDPLHESKAADSKTTESEAAMLNDVQKAAESGKIEPSSVKRNPSKIENTLDSEL